MGIIIANSVNFLRTQQVNKSIYLVTEKWDGSLKCFFQIKIFLDYKHYRYRILKDDQQKIVIIFVGQEKMTFIWHDISPESTARQTSSGYNFDNIDVWNYYCSKNKFSVIKKKTYLILNAVITKIVKIKFLQNATQI